MRARARQICTVIVAHKITKPNWLHWLRLLNFFFSLFLSFCLFVWLWALALPRIHIYFRIVTIVSQYALRPNNNNANRRRNKSAPKNKNKIWRRWEKCVKRNRSIVLHALNRRTAQFGTALYASVQHNGAEESRRNVGTIMIAYWIVFVARPSQASQPTHVRSVWMFDNGATTQQLLKPHLY